MEHQFNAPMFALQGSRKEGTASKLIANPDLGYKSGARSLQYLAQESEFIIIQHADSCRVPVSGQLCDQAGVARAFLQEKKH